MYVFFMIFALHAEEITGYGFYSRAILPEEFISVSKIEDSQLLILSDLKLQDSLVLSYEDDIGTQKNLKFSDGNSFAFISALEKKITIANQNNKGYYLPLNLTILVLPKDTCDVAVYYVGVPYVNFNYSISADNGKKTCVFSPNSNYYEEVDIEFVSGSGTIKYFTFPLENSKNVPTNENSMNSRATVPYFHQIVAQKANSVVNFRKVHSGGIEWIWNRCVSREFGSISLTGVLSEGKTLVDQKPYCYKPFPPKGFTREDADVVGTIIPTLILGVVIPILAIYGVISPALRWLSKILGCGARGAKDRLEEAAENGSTESPVTREDIEKSTSEESYTSGH